MEVASIIEKGMYVLLGVLVTAITNHFLSKSRERQIHRAISYHTAAEKFRQSFDDALFNIEQGQHNINMILHEFFITHKLAMRHFKHNLTGITRWRFRKAWNKYENFYHKYYTHYGKDSVLAQFASAKTEIEIQKLNELRKHIENLLKFTT
jgi:hypothetical protein